MFRPDWSVTKKNSELLTVGKTQNKLARSGTISELLLETWKLHSHTIIIIKSSTLQ